MGNYTHIIGTLLCEDIRNRDILLEELEYLGIEYGLFLKDQKSEDIFFYLEVKNSMLETLLDALKAIAGYNQKDDYGDEWNIAGIFDNKQRDLDGV